VFSTIMCASFRQLITVFFLCAILNTLLKYLNIKKVVDIIKIYKLSRCNMALNCKKNNCNFKMSKIPRF
jgi:hypothetical protein